MFFFSFSLVFLPVPQVFLLIPLSLFIYLRSLSYVSLFLTSFYHVQRMLTKTKTNKFWFFIIFLFFIITSKCKKSNVLMRQHNVWCVCVMLPQHHIVRTHAHQTLCCHITTLYARMHTKRYAATSLHCTHACTPNVMLPHHHI
jgi:hypothetical protein